MTRSQLKAKLIVAANIARIAIEYNAKRFGYPAGTLSGSCGLAAIEVWKRINQSWERPPLLVVADSDPHIHAFVTVGPYLVDVTATQFGMLPVEVRTLKSAQEFYWWQPDTAFETPHDFIRATIKDGWWWPREYLKEVRFEK
jgi:hypothetical protein